jgi:hypothetical protein
MVGGYTTSAGRHATLSWNAARTTRAASIHPALALQTEWLQAELFGAQSLHGIES